MLSTTPIACKLCPTRLKFRMVHSSKWRILGTAEASGVVFFAEGRNGQSLAIRFPLGNLPNSEYWSRMRLISNLLSKKSNYHKGREFIVPFEVVDRYPMNGEWIPAIVMPNLRDCKSLGDRVKEYYGME